MYPERRTIKINKKGEAKSRIISIQTLKSVLRILFTSAIIVFLVIVLIKIIMPRENPVLNPPPQEEKIEPASPDEGLKANGDDLSQDPSDTYFDDEEGETIVEEVEESYDISGIYTGNGEVETGGRVVTWEFDIEFIGNQFNMVDGRIYSYDDIFESPVSETGFKLSASSLEMEVYEKGSVIFETTQIFDSEKSNVFSLNEQRQFYIYVTPKKIGMSIDSIPKVFLIDRENTPLISMQGFLREDGMVFGTFRSPFGPDVEYVLESL